MAMEGSIKVAPQLLIETTEQVNNLMKDAEGVLENMNAKITGMAGVWDGNVFKSYTRQFGDLSGKISEKHGEITRYLSGVKEMAEQYIAADDNAQKVVDSLPTVL